MMHIFIYSSKKIDKLIVKGTRVTRYYLREQ